jgi:hypothetical protein
MAKKANTGSNLAKNPFKTAMQSAINNAATISAYVLAALYSLRLTDIRILALYNYLLTTDTAIQLDTVELTAETIQKIAATKVIATTQKGLQPFVKEIFRQIDNVYNEGTPNYNRLLIGGTKGFYGGSRNAIMTRFNALVTAIGSDASLATTKVLAQTVATNILTNTSAQTGAKTTMSSTAGDVKTDVVNSTKALWYVYGGLIQIFINTPATILTFFPMTFIYFASKIRTKTVVVPKATIKKILKHLFKVGETVTIKNNGTGNLMVGLALTATSEVLIWYVILPGETVTNINYNLLGNVTYPFVMVQNASLTLSGNITFTINGI